MEVGEVGVVQARLLRITDLEDGRAHAIEDWLGVVTSLGFGGLESKCLVLSSRNCQGWG